MTENHAQPEPPKINAIRLVIQASIPFESPEHAAIYYNMLKEMITSQSEDSTLNGQIVRMMEPCCGKNAGQKLFPGVQTIGPTPYRR